MEKQKEIQTQKERENLEVQANLKRQASIIKTRTTRANNLQEKIPKKWLLRIINY